MKTRPAIRIRQATKKDADGILVCLQQAFAPYRARYTPEAFRDTVLTPATVHQRLKEMSVLVAIGETGEVGGTISYALLGHHEGHLRGMAVHPSWQGCGVAQQLLASVESELRRRACSHISLDTTESLRRALRFYERNGFRASGKVTDFFGMPLFEYVKTLTGDRLRRSRQGAA